MSHCLICIEVALPYLLIHEIIRRNGVFNCHNYCKSSTDHTSQSLVSSSHDLLIPSAATPLQTARQPNHSAMPTQNAKKPVHHSHTNWKHLNTARNFWLRWSVIKNTRGILTCSCSSSILEYQQQGSWERLWPPSFSAEVQRLAAHARLFL